MARILAVDDTPQNLILVQAQLERAGHSVLTADNGASALSLVADQSPDLILLDVMMPGMDGYEVCRRLKADPGSARIPVIMLTALREPADKVRGLEAGASDFLTKPFERAELLARVNTLLKVAELTSQLSRSEAKYRGLVERLPLITFIAALEDPVRLLYVSPQVEGLLGFPASAWTEPGFWASRLHPDDSERALGSFTIARAIGRDVDTEYRLIDSAGQPVWFRSEGVVCQDEDTGATVLQGFLHDITLRRAAEDESHRLTDAVERERSTLSAVISSMTEGLLVLDAETAVSFCNDKAGELLGFPPGEINDRELEELLLGMGEKLLDPAHTMHALNGALTKVESRPTFEMALGGSNRRDLVVEIFPVTGSGANRETGVLLHDVTHEREL
ncbi:MAG: response regulator, partial [Chloroflexi bacterium]|nr:response regulator [Chloroflexota bacterium]